MYNRHLHLPPAKSLFLFGPRQTGKSTLVKAGLTPRDLERFAREPERFSRDADRPRRSYAAPPADPFFDKPYEPAAVSQDRPAWDQKAAVPAPARGLSPNIRSKHKVGSLLGGGKA